MEYSKIEIRQVNGNPAFTEILVDGHKLPLVRSWKLEHGVGDAVPILTVDLNALNISTDLQTIMYQQGIGEIEEIKFKEP